MTKIKAFIFDLDGVLVDTAKFHYQAWKSLASELGFHFSENDNEKLKGISRMRSLEILLETAGLNFSANEKALLADKKNETYIGFISKMTPGEVLPGVVPFLESCRQLNLKTAIGSASKNTPLILERTAIAGYFDVIVDGNSVSEAKPNPAVFIRVAEMLAVAPAECIVFEDASAGIEAACIAGMKCVGVGLTESLKEADFVISGFKEISASDIILKF